MERGLLDEAQFAELVFHNPARLFLGANPGFFAGTPVEAHATEAALRRA